jgi:hypothetical protein
VFYDVRCCGKQYSMMSNTVYGYRLLKNHCLLDHPKKSWYCSFESTLKGSHPRGAATGKERGGKIQDLSLDG